jgi:hypothetical protein
VGGLGEEYRNAQPPRQHGEAGDVVDVLMGDEDGAEGGGVFADSGHAPQQLAATQAGVHQDARRSGCNHGGVALGARG